MSSRVPVPENVPGDFYVEDGCCLFCQVPAAEAPEHFAYTEASCYVCKQPETPSELERMINAMAVQEVDCIRYRGVNQQVLIRLLALGEGQNCDHVSRELAVSTPRTRQSGRQ